MKSDNGFSLLKKLNIKIDFCYIDGSHYYDGIKNDYNNFSSILRKKENYVGCICGDDYELVFTAPLTKENSIFNMARATKTRITRIGTIQSGKGISIFDKNSKERI